MNFDDLKEYGSETAVKAVSSLFSPSTRFSRLVKGVWRTDNVTCCRFDRLVSFNKKESLTRWSMVISLTGSVSHLSQLLHSIPVVLFIPSMTSN